MSKRLNKYIAALEFADKTLFVLSDTNSGVFLCSFTAVTGTHFEKASARISVVFLISNDSSKSF